jgi:hypothetical protein
VAAAPVAPTPPSPVPTTPPPTPADSADAGDPILRAAAPEQARPAASQAQRQSMMIKQLNANISVSFDLPPRPKGAAGIDIRYSLSGASGF